MAYTLDEAKVEIIARGFFQTQQAPSANPDAVLTLSVQLIYTVEEWTPMGVTTTGADGRPRTTYPTESVPAWRRYRPQAVTHYVAMHEMGLI